VPVGALEGNEAVELGEDVMLHAGSAFSLMVTAAWYGDKDDHQPVGDLAFLQEAGQRAGDILQLRALLVRTFSS